MKKSKTDKLIEILWKTPASYYKRGHDWKGYEVYDLI